MARRLSVPPPFGDLQFPDSDGEPLSDNTRQYQWIVTIQGGLDALLPDFVGGDLLWYPDPTSDKVRAAPDVLVALGRPKGHRGSYKQWEEDGVAPQVLFEIISPGNSGPELARKRGFYTRHGVQEYYELDPDRNLLRGWVRGDDQLIEIANVDGWTSPLLGIRFHTGPDEPRLLHPDGRTFRTFRQVQTDERRVAAAAEQERQRAEQERQRAERAIARAEVERRSAEQARAQASRLAARLRALGVDPDTL